MRAQRSVCVHDECRFPGDLSVEPSAVLEVLHGALVFFRGRARLERAEIPPLARLRILLARIQAVVPALQFPNHSFPPRARVRDAVRNTETNWSQTSAGFVP